jgi:ribosomal protein L4
LAGSPEYERRWRGNTAVEKNSDNLSSSCSGVRGKGKVVAGGAWGFVQGARGVPRRGNNRQLMALMPLMVGARLGGVKVGD